MTDQDIPPPPISQTPQESSKSCAPDGLSETIEAELLEAQIPPITQTEDDPRIKGVIEQLRHVYDPEIPANIYELGLIYRIYFDAEDEDLLRIDMTLTSPNCPVAEELPQWTKEAAEKADGIIKATVDITWDPPWNPTMMAESAKYQLNMF